MKREEAEEYTQALALVQAGGWRQTLLAVKLGVPDALGLSTEEWVRDRLGGYIRLSIPERRAAVGELNGEGLSQREIAGVLGVGQKTVSRDLAGESNDSHAEDQASANAGTQAIAESNDSQQKSPAPNSTPLQPAPPPSFPHSERLERWLKWVSDEAAYIDHPKEGGGLGGLPALLAERDKWDWQQVRDSLLPTLDELAQTIARYQKELASHANVRQRGKRVART